MKNISKKRLLEFYVTMLRIRRTQLAIEKEYPQDEMKTPIHLCLGQEAIAAGVCANLHKDDIIKSVKEVVKR